MENDDPKPPPPTGAQPSSTPYPYPYTRQPLSPTSYNRLLNLQQQRLQTFWTYQRQEIEEEAQDFKYHPLPLATIKRIMKFDKSVNMISAEASILFAKACELFIMELTIRSWMHAEANRCGTLQKDDVFAAVRGDDRYVYLLDDVVPKDETKNQGGGGQGVMGSMVSGVPYYYLPGCIMGRPAIDQSVYPQKAPLQAWQGNMAYGSGSGGGGVGQGVSGVQHYYPPGAIMGRPAIDQSVYPQPAPLQAIDLSGYPQPAPLQAWQPVRQDDMAYGSGGGGDQGNLYQQG
ncbi:hypothetical protein Leryth_001957 [Lithospermum erythrorhizon]|nr:hypothetical protein Leryth_001957 [Lithospermum erythrorhizon]